MYLERIEIVGFRGINRLSLTLDENTVLIGENAWGKSSLLDALTLCLSPNTDLYHFEPQDFYFPPGDETAKERYLQIIFVFCESDVGTIMRHAIGLCLLFGRMEMIVFNASISAKRGSFATMARCALGVRF